MNIVILNPAQKTVLNFWINSVDPEDFGDLWAAEKNEKTGKYQLDLRFVGSVGFTDDKAYAVKDELVQFILALVDCYSPRRPKGIDHYFDTSAGIVFNTREDNMSLQKFVDLYL